MAFSTLYRCKWLADDATSVSEMADRLEAAAKNLREMHAAGVKLDGKVEDDYAELVTDDPEVAERFGLHDPGEDELEEDDDD